MTTARFAVIGLGTMGRNLALNIESRGVPVAVWNLENLLLDLAIGDLVEGAQEGWRRMMGRVALSGIPMPAHASALAYFDSYRTVRLPQSLTQAQRDAFGAHTYERVDRPGFVHSEW